MAKTDIDSEVIVRLTKLSAQLDAYMTFNDEQHKHLTDRLEAILEQARRTNGRVTDLEKYRMTHETQCPAKKEIEKINESLLEYRFVVKYPKVLVMVLSMAILLQIVVIIKML